MGNVQDTDAQSDLDAAPTTTERRINLRREESTHLQDATNENNKNKNGKFGFG